MDKTRYWLVRDKYDGQADAVELDRDLRRVAAGEPLDYVIGWSDFLACRIGLEGRPLIPRPETEYWTKRVIDGIGKQELRVLDIFAGSGAIGVAILLHCPNVTVDFIEQDEKLCGLIAANCRQNGVDDSRYRVFRSDLFFALTEPIEYDRILANPPYIPDQRVLDRSVAAWEPAQALFAGPDGLKIITAFIGQVGKHLASRGTGWLEFDTGQEKKIAALLAKQGLTAEFARDQFGRSRFVMFKKLTT